MPMKEKLFCASPGRDEFKHSVIMHLLDTKKKIDVFFQTMGTVQTNELHEIINDIDCISEM